MGWARDKLGRNLCRLLNSFTLNRVKWSPPREGLNLAIFMVQISYFQAYNRVGKYKEAIGDCDTAIKVGAHTYTHTCPHAHMHTCTHAHTHTHTHHLFISPSHTTHTTCSYHPHTPHTYTTCSYHPHTPHTHTTCLYHPHTPHTHTLLVHITLTHHTPSHIPQFIPQLEPNTLKAYLQKGKAYVSLHKLNQVRTTFQYCDIHTSVVLVRGLCF